MFTLYKIDGNKKQLSVTEGNSLLAQNPYNWKNKKTESGTIYTEILDTIFTGETILEAYSPKHNSFASSLLNNTASKIVGFEVYGECLVEENGS